MMSLTHGEDVNAMQAALMEASYFGRDGSAEVRLRRRDGTHVWAEFRCRPAQDGDIVAVTRDISERKLQEQALVEARDAALGASRAKSSFLANMSHELRTPLNAINGFSEIMAGEMFGPLGDAKYKGYAADILKSGQHLLSLINDVLDMAKIEAGKMTLHYDTVSLKEVVDDAVRLMRGKIEDAGLELRIDAPDLPDIDADYRGLKQVVLNLISNAVKFTPEGGNIVIAISHANPGRLRVAVSDTGIGIAAEDLTTEWHEPADRLGEEQRR
jgi:signal transduction histidine kinase